MRVPFNQALANRVRWHQEPHPTSVEVARTIGEGNLLVFLRQQGACRTD
jgi:hypothetical protein